jgi:hypothetical protein
VSLDAGSEPMSSVATREMQSKLGHCVHCRAGSKAWIVIGWYLKFIVGGLASKNKKCCILDLAWIAIEWLRPVSGVLISISGGEWRGCLIRYDLIYGISRMAGSISGVKDRIEHSSMV